MEIEIFNLGNVFYPDYIVKTAAGLVKVDAGNATDYETFCAKLHRKGLSERDIKYLVLTHVHADHVAYLADLMHDVGPTLLWGSSAEENWLLGADRLMTYSSKWAKRLSEMAATLRGGAAKWQPLECLGWSRIVVPPKGEYRLDDVGLRVCGLPGHTRDSVMVAFDGGVCFVGDMLMNCVPAVHGLPLLIEDEAAFKESFARLQAMPAHIFYLGHGAPVGKAEMEKFAPYVEALHIV